MIVRAAKSLDYPLSLFDYFNDYDDTSRWLRRQGAIEAAERLDEGWHRWFTDWMARHAPDASPRG